MVWQFLTDEGEKRVLQNAAVKIGFHYPLEDTDSGSTVPADTSPDVNFEVVFQFWLSHRWFTILPVACMMELILVPQNDVTKRQKIQQAGYPVCL